MNKLIITLFSTFFVLAVANSLAAQDDITVPLSRPGQNGNLNIDLVYADKIYVRTHDRKDVIVRYDGEEEERGRSNRKNGLRRISSGGLSLEIVEDNNTVRINSQPNHNDLELTVLVPKNFSLKINVVHGDINIEGVQGELEIESVNGDIEIYNISGSAIISSVNGDIEASFMRIDPESPMSFTGVNGDIEVSFPENAKFLARMKTDWGDVYTNFGIEMDIYRNPSSADVTSKKGQYKVSINKWITGSVNGGGPEYLFKTLHGDISILKKM